MHGGPPFARAGATGETSAAAAEIAGRSALKLRDRLFMRIERRPSTPEELQQWLADEGSPTLLTTIRSRVCDMRRDGLLVDNGTRGLGESRKARVIRWRVTTASERQAALQGEASQ